MSTPRLTEITEKQYLDSFSARADRGELFQFIVTSTDGSFDTGDPIKILYITGAKRVKLRRTASFFGGNATIQVYKAPSVTADGDPVTVYNQDNSSDKVPLVKVYTSPTTNENGTICFPECVTIGSSTLPSRAVSSTSERTNRTLDANTEYLVVLTAGSENMTAVYNTEFFEVK